MSVRLAFMPVIAIAALLSGGCAHRSPPWEDRSLERLTSSELRKFEDAEDFARWVDDVRGEARKRDLWWASTEGKPASSLLASNDDVPPCNPEEEECDTEEELIVVSASRASSASVSITNNQEAGVDEGDIVKRFRNFLILLQDGRLFSIHTGAVRGTLDFVDRVDVYTDASAWAWYDELLISGSTAIVTGYSYSDDATEITLFDIGDDGVFDRRGTIRIESSDYYSSENYATRLVDGDLVLYTPLYIPDVDDDEPVIFPRYQGETADGTRGDWQPLFTATDLYKPIQVTLEPTVHVISVCRIDGAAMECNSSGIIGPWSREFYVSADNAFIWNSASIDEWYDVWDDDIDCADDYASTDYSPSDAVLYRIPLFGGQTTAVRVAGAPIDQFSLDQRDDAFHALVFWPPDSCVIDDLPPLRYGRIPMRKFVSKPQRREDSLFVPVPDVSAESIENRFTRDYLVYAGAGEWWSGGPDPGDDPVTGSIVAVPLGDPDRPLHLPLDHGVKRVELFGDAIVITGYYDASGLWISSLALDGGPRVAGTVALPGYFETEGRSHAFNYVLGTGASGLFGIPVATRDTTQRWYWHWLRDNADIAYFNADGRLNLSSAGMLYSTPDLEPLEYDCEVSCYDWYGNARPFFFDDRVFALSGSEIIEGAMVGGSIVEVGRVSVMTRPSHRRGD